MILGILTNKRVAMIAISNKSMGIINLKFFLFNFIINDITFKIADLDVIRIVE